MEGRKKERKNWKLENNEWMSWGQKHVKWVKEKEKKKNEKIHA